MSVMNLRTTVFLVLVLTIACTPAQSTSIPTKPLTQVTAAPAAATVPPTAAPAASAPTTKPATTATPAPKVKRGGQLKAAVQNDWQAMDPLINTVGTLAQDQMFDTIIKWRRDEKGNWGATPGLAESWEAKPDEIVFKLNRGIKFQDGSDLNADVVVWNLERFRTDPKSQQRVDMECMAGTEKGDDYTVRARLKQPCATLFAVLSQAGSRPAHIISKAAFDKLGAEQFNRNPVGSGPFSFVEWMTGDHLTIKKWDNYWRKGADGQALPYLDGVSFRLIIDDSVRLLEARAGNIQVTDLIQGKDIPAIKANPDLVLMEGPWVGNNYRMAFNSRQGSFKGNQKLRQAALYAIDRENISKVLGQGAGVPLRYVLLPGSLAYDETVPYYSFDENKARQLLRDAGYPNGLDITLDVISRQLDQQQAQMIQQMWDKIGLRTNLLVSERVAWGVKTRDTGNYEVTTMRNPSEADPGLDTIKYLSGSHPASYHKYVNADFEKCLAEGNSVYDAAKRKEIYKRCQTIAFEDAFEGFIWVQTWNWLLRKEVKDFRPPWGEHWELAEVWLDR